MTNIDAALRRLDQDAEDPSRQAAAAFADAARTAGLLDVAYATVDSPFGPLLLAATRRGLVRLAYPNEPVDDALQELAAEVSPRVLESPAALDDLRRQLDEYFDGGRSRFDTRIDWSLTKGFTTRVLRATARVPFGRVTTYREVAGKAGNDRAYRAAGNALGSNPIPIVVPCHRVLHSGGGLGGYTGGLDRKEFLLRLEGVLD
ncbi:MAG TPA: methylated-DNA--[protein]-cysteine S-methyltransferase [Actinomycetota bacterium]|nr:methylated-DNA--[protein]-cysteine S-methyltransferase [Actinomycetota bacterium]